MFFVCRKRAPRLCVPPILKDYAIDAAGD